MRPAYDIPAHPFGIGLAKQAKSAFELKWMQYGFFDILVMTVAQRIVQNMAKKQVVSIGVFIAQAGFKTCRFV